MQWYCKRFHELSLDELYSLLQLRCDIFVVEQNCPYPELDDKDRLLESRHLFAIQNNTMVAYARLLPAGSSYQQHSSIGRVAVHQDYRQAKLGHLLMTKATQETMTRWPDVAIKISAQAHLERFYNAHHFTTSSAIYLEDGIEHIEMVKLTR